jgi:hypothetical protein
LFAPIVIMKGGAALAPLPKKLFPKWRLDEDGREVSDESLFRIPLGAHAPCEEERGGKPSLMYFFAPPSMPYNIITCPSCELRVITPKGINGGRFFKISLQRKRQPRPRRDSQFFSFTPHR